MKKFLISLYLLFVITFLICEQTKAEDENNNSLSIDQKIDSIYVKQKEIYQTIKNEPLGDKKYGIEINIFRLLGYRNDHYSFSGGFSLFDIDRNAEIAFPIFYSNTVNDEEYIRQFTLDCHYRYFLGNTQKGFYISGFIRYANIRGYLGSWLDCWYYEVNEIDTENKIGIGIGIGFRTFSHKGFYWGTSLNLGGYYIGENCKFRGHGLWYDNDEEVIIIFEILKFGWAF